MRCTDGKIYNPYKKVRKKPSGIIVWVDFFNYKYADEHVKELINKQIKIIMAEAEKYSTTYYTHSRNHETGISVVFDVFDENIADKFIDDMNAAFKKERKQHKQLCAFSYMSIKKYVMGYEKYESKRMKYARLARFMRILNAMGQENK